MSRPRRYPMRFVCGIAAVILGICILVSMLSAQRLPVGPVAADCNRACLEGLINQYIDAVLAHDPKRLPLSADVKYTEQEQVMEVGDGFWKTAAGETTTTTLQIRSQGRQDGW